MIIIKLILHRNNFFKCPKYLRIIYYILKILIYDVSTTVNFRRKPLKFIAQ